MLWSGFPLYILAGVIVLIAYRWDKVDTVDGKELLLDILLWPIVVYYWWKHSRG